MCVFLKKKKEFVCVHVSASYIVLMLQNMCVCVCVCKDRSHVWKQSESMNSWLLEDSLS